MAQFGGMIVADGIDALHAWPSRPDFAASLKPRW